VLKHGEVNPLNVHGLRQLEFNPPHFTDIILESRSSEKEISDWIWENLQGRFYVGPIDIINDGHYTRKICISFELEEEVSYFSLGQNQF
jgi:hypothetical protein